MCSFFLGIIVGLDVYRSNGLTGVQIDIIKSGILMVLNLPTDLNLHQDRQAVINATIGMANTAVPGTYWNAVVCEKDRCDGLFRWCNDLYVIFTHQQSDATYYIEVFVCNTNPPGPNVNTLP